jgi:hypothetical protein
LTGDALEKQKKASKQASKQASNNYTITSLPIHVFSPSYFFLHSTF